MNKLLTIKRTNGGDEDFNLLIQQLDIELWTIMNEVQATYDKFNKVPEIKTVVVAYENNKPVASGCFKKFADDTVEIKRMYVVPDLRRKGVAEAVLNELETWAKELKFTKAVLETGKRMTSASNLYKKCGYTVTENYGQYIGLEESVCMMKKLGKPAEPSGFRDLKNIEYFDFEEDFTEENVRCIPMIVRFKMDLVGIKLQLSEWSMFSIEEKNELVLKVCGNDEEKRTYRNFLSAL
ncbi:MAG: GNAT family N-acetyltransferase, partial [Bacteroidia bacterium]|nr:GNAT family N-acetyltransferase [Bacteroidia bacterium]